MDFIAAIMAVFSKFAVFGGRASSTEFWWWALFVASFEAAALAVSLPFGMLFLVAILLPTAAVTSRRLRDTNRSGWWALLALVPFPGIPFLAALLVFEGTRGNNRFGPDPLGREPYKAKPPLHGSEKKSVAEWRDRQ